MSEWAEFSRKLAFFPAGSRQPVTAEIAAYAEDERKAKRSAVIHFLLMLESLGLTELPRCSER